MRKPSALLAATVAVASVALAGTVAASAGSGEITARYGTSALPEDLTPAQQQAIATLQADAPIPVQDPQGEPRGFVRDSELTARDARVTDAIVAGLGEPNGLTAQEFNTLYEAMRVLDPVVVVDADGTTVGYWTHNFKEIDELKELTPGAQATVDQMLG